MKLYLAWLYRPVLFFNVWCINKKKHENESENQLSYLVPCLASSVLSCDPNSVMYKIKANFCRSEARPVAGRLGPKRIWSSLIRADHVAFHGGKTCWSLWWFFAGGTTSCWWISMFRRITENLLMLALMSLTILPNFEFGISRGMKIKRPTC